ncbi:SurA N-terminal domain-containing protein [Aliiglaciecola sp. CAU 1673]|uniref:SurA N-terminal domain-containing protein n=1 Tax=Aliiglaciecola sp. CAU 1673 TaxID=3032595 RepID=UPI0023DA4FCE|nr:SurA N-terminal domain-containing protein [Aliiglaciecola sp. CAU 1673]MDF2179590.1 SurA N-terminal domain-containing protein [Aliiglaciecola sp. CAU 1673]
MLERIREGAQGFWAKAILGLVILTFALAGVGSYLNAKSDNPVATVNGEDIPQSSLERAYQNERARMESQYGEAFADLMADSEYMKSFRSGLVDRLIAEKLIEQTAKDMGLRVSDQQIRDAIVSMPEFQIAGTFNNERYLAVLRQAGFQPADFRDLMRRDMTRQQVVRAVMGSEFSLDNEAQYAFGLQQQSRDIKHLSINASTFRDQIEVSEQEVQAHYQANIDQFDTQERVALNYVELKVEDLLNDIQVSDEDIQTFYERNADKYRTEAQRRVSHILFETGDDANAAREQAEQVLARLKAGEDFVELAKTYSADTFSAESGGDLDWFGRDVMDPAFEEASFALQNIGDLSDVVESEFGLHIIKLTDVRPEQVQSLADVRDQILEEVKGEKAQAAFYELQQQIAEVAFEMPDNLEEVAARASKSIEHTELFSRSDAPELFSSTRILNTAFSPELVEQGVNSEVLEVSPDHIVVIRVAEHEPQRTKSLDEVKQGIEDLLVAEKAQQAAKAWASDLVAKQQAGEDIEALLAEKSLSWTTSEGVKRFGGALMPSVTEKAFQLSAEDNNLAVVETADGNVSLVQVTAIHDAPAAEPAMLDGMQQRLASGRGQQLYMDFIESLKAQADVKILAMKAPE